MTDNANLNIKRKVEFENKDFEIKKGRNGQGVSILLDRVKLAIDHWDPAADLLFVSHGHMDHLFKIPRDDLIKFSSKANKLPKLLCSEITKAIMDYRVKDDINYPEDAWLTKQCRFNPFKMEYGGIKFTLLQNGHTYGSTSLLIEGSKTIFYASEFISEKRILEGGESLMNELTPQLCDYLIIDATFGEPFYKFPPFGDLVSLTNQIIEDYLQEGFSVILLGYSYGKSQILLKMLTGDYPIYVSREIGEIVHVLEDYGIKFRNHEVYSREIKKRLEEDSKFIFIATPNDIFKNPLLNIIKKGAKSMIFSGRVSLESYREKYRVDNYIPLSDHSDYEATISFIEKCAPRKIFLESGRIEILSYILMKRIGSHQAINVLI